MTAGRVDGLGGDASWAATNWATAWGWAGRGLGLVLVNFVWA